MDLLTRFIKSRDRAYDAAELPYTEALAHLRHLDVASRSTRALVRGRGYLAVFCAVKRGED